MIADLTPSPAMKDSGVPWLGEVPKHREVLPNRALFAEVKERDHPEEEMLSVTITKGVIRQQALLVDSSKKDSSNQDKSAYKLVRPGDIAYNKMRAWQRSVGVSDYQGIVSPAYVVERPRDGTDSRYLHYLLRTPAFSKEAERWSYGITSDMWTLGEREGGTERLEQAVTAFTEALKEWTRERVPHDWAMTQKNLGRAIQLLRERGRAF